MSPLDEQEQINQLSLKVQELSDTLQDITILLLGDKLKDPNARSLIDDIQQNREYRISISKRINWAGAIGGSSIIGLFVKSFWASLMALISSGGSP